VWTTPAFAAAPPAQRVVLVGHHDTVFPPGTFEVWERQGDRLRGPGVLDMKGGLATIRTALAALADVGALADLPLALCSVADEETGSNHSRPLLEELARGAGAALVFESGRATDQIVTQRKGTGKVLVTVTGTAAHAGNNLKDGRNALWALARFIDFAQGQTDWDRGVTVNVGLASGGTSANTVPAHARCDIDFRYVHAVDGHALLDAFAAQARAIDAALGTSTAIEGGIRRAPLERTAASAAPARALRGVRAGRGPGRRRGAAAGRRLRRQHRQRDRRAGDRRARPARQGLPHPRRVHRGADPGAAHPRAGPAARDVAARGVTGAARRRAGYS
jgi:glutamate carboxypeptidase